MLFRSEHTIYSDDRLTVTARPAAVGIPLKRLWCVRFVQRSSNGLKIPDTYALWNPRLPSPQRWDRWRWRPIDSNLCTPAQLEIVEAWLEGQPVEGKP